jgi:uncharacterized membrane protein YkvI
MTKSKFARHLGREVHHLLRHPHQVTSFLDSHFLVILIVLVILLILFANFGRRASRG